MDPDGRSAPSIRWTPAATGRDEPELARWRAAVGPVRVRNATGIGAPKLPLTVAAWNAQVGGGAIRRLWNRIAPDTGKEAVPAVLLLQEVFATGPDLPEVAAGSAWADRITGTPQGEDRTDIVSFAREASLSLVYVPSMRNGGPDGGPPEDRGNAILANVPLSSARAIELPFERQRRVAAAAEVTIGGRRVALCSVHLENRAPWARAWRTLGSGRGRQMAGLLGVFPGNSHADAFVLGGDLNTWMFGRREAAYTLARRTFRQPEHPDPRPTHHLEVGGWLRRADYLLFRLPPGWRGEYRTLDDSFGSDHYPLVGDIRKTAGFE